MEIARTVATRGTCDRGRTGCIVVRDRQILATGYVGAPPGLPHCDEIGHQMKSVTHEDGHTSQHCMRTTHAEANAIARAAKFGIALDGGTLYCKMSPCPTCAKLIIGVGIKRIVCDKLYQSAAESEQMFKQAGVDIIYLSQEIQNYDGK